MIVFLSSSSTNCCAYCINNLNIREQQLYCACSCTHIISLLEITCCVKDVGDDSPGLSAFPTRTKLSYFTKNISVYFWQLVTRRRQLSHSKTHIHTYSSTYAIVSMPFLDETSLRTLSPIKSLWQVTSAWRWFLVHYLWAEERRGKEWWNDLITVFDKWRVV